MKKLMRMHMSMRTNIIITVNMITRNTAMIIMNMIIMNIIITNIIMQMKYSARSVYIQLTNIPGNRS